MIYWIAFFGLLLVTVYNAYLTVTGTAYIVRGELDKLMEVQIRIMDSMPYSVVVGVLMIVVMVLYE